MKDGEFSELVLPCSYEELENELSTRNIDEAMMDFFVPITEMEEKILELTHRIRSSGKLSFILGSPGTGKSTFLQSLSWRKHINIRKLHYFDAQNHSGKDKLIKLTEYLNEISEYALDTKDMGPTCVVINYLESLEDIEEKQVKGFFRDLNGLLRRAPLLVLWPLTERHDAKQMLKDSENVSGTLFQRGYEMIDFMGPPKNKFCDIVTRTIEVINNKDLSDFDLNTTDLESVLSLFYKKPLVNQTIRNFLYDVKEYWEKKSEHFTKIRKKLPKQNEVWFIFAYKNAEDVVKQFARQSEHAENAWVAVHEKLYEYIRENDQRKSIWDSQRLQLALNGALKTRILFVSTNSLIMTINSYSDNALVRSTLEEYDFNRNWGLKHKAQESLGRTPLVRLLKSEDYPIGKKKGKSTQEALKTAEPAFKSLNKLIGKNQLSDSHLNKAICDCINECIDENAVYEKFHPWIKGIRPDIFIDSVEKQICLEFCYTDKEVPSVIAGYVLKKLNIYMNQIEGYSGQGVLEFN